MATQDNSLGLLSKVAKFVRNPTKDWSALDKPDTEVMEDDGKQALKQMIIRKRHDDAVRKYEFAQLRKLRRDPAAAKNAVVPTPTGFNSSKGDLDDDERESTLKKIDDIEAQMSQQWWKGRGHPPASASASAPAAKPQASVEASPSVINETVLPSGPTDRFQATVPSQQFDTSDELPTKISLVGAMTSAEYNSTVPGDAAAHHGISVFEASGRGGLISALPSTDAQPVAVADPELEEAAIRYANGDDVGAESVLKAAVLQDASLEALEGRLAALLDLYRGGGQQANFERTALDYAQRIGRSAPMWTPTRQLQLGEQAERSGQTEPTTIRWECPAELDEVAVERLGFFGGSDSAVYLLDWSSLQRITTPATTIFSRLVAQWCSKPLVFSFVGTDKLLSVLEGLSVAGDPTVPQSVWMLRMELLRLLRRQDDYERVALDFCITYEISPPAWRTPLCHLVEKVFGNEHEPFEAGLMSGDVMPALGADLEGQAVDVLYRLSGELLGNIKVMLADLEKRPKPEGVWVIACEQLVRVDFAAAGALLNWVAQAQADGAAIEFQQVPRLVAAFFHLIGISDYARVVPRFV